MNRLFFKYHIVIFIVLLNGVSVYKCHSQNYQNGRQKYLDTYQSLFEKAGDTILICDIAIRNYPSDYVLDNIRLFVYKRDGQWMCRQIKYYWDNGSWIVEFHIQVPVYSDPLYDIDSLFQEVIKTTNVPQEENNTEYCPAIYTKLHCKVGDWEYEKEIVGNMRNIQRQYPSLFAFVSWAYFESIEYDVEKSIRYKEESHRKNYND